MPILGWFSCGIASAVATHLVQDAELIYIGIASAHPDNERFIFEFERFDGRKVKEVSGKYRDQFQVIEKERFINSPTGSKCTSELKVKIRSSFSGTHVFGFTVEEKERAKLFRLRNPEIEILTPLIDAGYTKSDCRAIVKRWGIEIPKMYRLGYKNNNCIGCVKGGKGYWKKIRRDFPAYFDRMAKLERKINASCIKNTFLDELNNEPELFEDAPECSHFCGGY